MVLACYLLYCDMVVESIAIPQMGIVIRCPDDILTCGAVNEQRVKYAAAHRQQFVLFDVYVVHMFSQYVCKVTHFF